VDGRHAWAVCIAVSVSVGLGFGIAYSFGTFFKEMADEFDASRGTTALAFGFTILLFFGLGIVTGPLSDRYGIHRLLLAAAVVMSLGLFLTSRVDQLWLGFLTYGIGVGVGAGLYVTPGFAVVAGWFEQSRAVALGVASAGSGLGTLVIVPLANRLIEAYGWRTAYLVLAVAALVVLLLASTIIDSPPVPPAPPARDRMGAVARTPSFKLLFASGLLTTLALFVAFAFVVPFAEDEGISSTAAAVLVGIIGASSVAGRLVLSGLTHRLGPLRLYQLCLGVQPFAYILWLVSDGRYAVLVVFAVLLGVSYGGYVALAPTVTAELFGLVGLGSVLGLLFLAGGIGGFLGPPLAGYLADATDGQIVPIAVSLVVTVVAALITAVIPDRPIEEVGGEVTVEARPAAPR
jgi:MFS family permease